MKAFREWGGMIGSVAVAVYGAYFLLHVFSRHDIETVFSFAFFAAIFGGISYTFWNTAKEASKKGDEKN